MVAALYECQVRHNRVQPLHYGFRHRSYYWLVDLDDEPRLPVPLRPLARFRSADHAGDPTKSLRCNVVEFLAGHGIDIGAGRISMLAQPRVFGYVFNPLSVFWCHDPDGALRAVVAEVHNTYGGRHRYLLRSDVCTGAAQITKEFYVSPFFTVDGAYRVLVPEPSARLSVLISLARAGERPFTASLTGRRLPVTAANLLRLAVRHPLHTLVISALIRWHGIRLFLKGLPVTPRPAIEHEVIAGHPSAKRHS
jgi:uncharacterized protein